MPRKKKYEKCRLCRRPLTTEKSQLAGYGPTCGKDPRIAMERLEKEGQLRLPGVK
jgi:hypothetical protein